MLLDRFHLRPHEVDALDPDFVDELLVFLEADAAHQRRERKRLARKTHGEDVDDDPELREFMI